MAPASNANAFAPDAGSISGADSAKQDPETPIPSRVMPAIFIRVSFNVPIPLLFVYIWYCLNVVEYGGRVWRCQVAMHDQLVLDPLESSRIVAGEETEVFRG
jgi:hypothetical protein